MTTLRDRVQEAVESAGDRKLDPVEGVMMTALLDVVPTLKGVDARRAAIAAVNLMRRLATVPSTAERDS